MPTKRTKKPTAKVLCYFCQKEQPNDDDRCFGCGEVVCDACEQTNAMGHGHRPEAHRDPPDDRD